MRFIGAAQTHCKTTPLYRISGKRPFKKCRSRSSNVCRTLRSASSSRTRNRRRNKPCNIEQQGRSFDETPAFLRFRTDQGWQPREEQYMRKPTRPLARRIDERQPAPYQQISPEPVFCNAHERCQGCPYPRHGIVCWHRDGTCLRTDMEEIGRRQKNDSSSFK